MSVASQSRTIKFVSKAGTYSAALLSPAGDIFQMFKGNATDGYTLTPDFTVNNQTLNFVCISSRAAENNINGVVNPTSIVWEVDGVALTFSEGVSTNTFNGHTGHFEKINVGTNSNYCALKIVKNLATDFGYAPVTIKATATITRGLQSDDIVTMYTIPIYEASAETMKVTIAAGDSKNFVISEKGTSCILTAKVYNIDGEITSNLTYAWEKLTPNGWVSLGVTTQSLTVADTDIDTHGLFRVVVSRNNTSVGMDIQDVMDASDPYVILPNPTPSDETIYDTATAETTADGGAVAYSPTVVKRGSAVAQSGFTFSYFVHDAYGNQLGTSNTVTKSMCEQAGGDVVIEIFANRT